jgi:hypothetical protein
MYAAGCPCAVKNIPVLQAGLSGSLLFSGQLFSSGIMISSGHRLVNLFPHIRYGTPVRNKGTQFNGFIKITVLFPPFPEKQNGGSAAGKHYRSP